MPLYLLSDRQTSEPQSSRHAQGWTEQIGVDLVGEDVAISGVENK